MADDIVRNVSDDGTVTHSHVGPDPASFSDEERAARQDANFPDLHNCASGKNGIVMKGDFGLRILETFFAVGQRIDGHAHNRDHWCIANRGDFEFITAKTKDEGGKLVPIEKPKTFTVRQGDMFFVRKGIGHTIKVLRLAPPDEWQPADHAKFTCLFAHTDEWGELQHYPVDLTAYY